MKKSDILFNLSTLKSGEKIKIYSEDKDLFKNEKIEVYTIEKGRDGLYVSYNHNGSFEKGDHSNIAFKQKVAYIGTPVHSKIEIDSMKLTKAERDALRECRLELNIIKKGCPLEGCYEEGFFFSFPNIIQIAN